MTTHIGDNDSSQNDAGSEPEEQSLQPADDPGREPDFAQEHTDVTVSRERGAGEDTEPEPESPQGLGGMDLPDHPQ
jgi:hypothetical protein